MHVRYERGIDFLLRSGRLMVWYLWQDDLVGYEKSGTLVRFEEYHLVPHDSSRGLVEALVVTVNQDHGLVFIIIYGQTDSVVLLSLVHHHCDESATPSREGVGDVSAGSGIHSLFEEFAHFLESVPEIVQEIVEGSSSAKLTGRIRYNVQSSINVFRVSSWTS